MTSSFLRGNQMILSLLQPQSLTRIIPLIQVWREEELKRSWRITCSILTRKSKELIISGPLQGEGAKRTRSTTGRTWVLPRTGPTRSSAFLAMKGSIARREFTKYTRPQICRKFHTSPIASNIDWVTNLTPTRA